MSAPSSETGRATNEDALWQALSAQPMATTAELSAASGVTASSARKILARWTDDKTVTRHAGDANSPHRWTVTGTDSGTVTPPDTDTAGTVPATDADAVNQDTDTADQDTDAPPAEPAAPAVSPADAPAPEDTDPVEPADPSDEEEDDEEEDEDDWDDEEEEFPFGALCPIAVGDEVANRYHRSWRGRVTELQGQDGIARCVIETPDGARSSIPPWVLVPAGDEGVPEEWQEEMDALIAAQRERAVEELQDRSATVREHLEYMAGRLNGIATALGSGTVPREDEAAPMADSVGDLEGAMGELSEFRALVADSGLLTVDEIKRAAARPAPVRPTGMRATTPAPVRGTGEKVAPLPPGGLRGMVEDALRDNPDRSFTTTELKRVMDEEHQRNISSGAISNALDKLTEQKIARRISDAPRTWELADKS